MRVMIQRVTSGKVTISGVEKAKIGKGYVVLFGVKEGDSEKEAEILAEKLVHLRIMSDDKDKMNLSIQETGGSIIVVSQFTLYADCGGGRRPSFIKAGNPETANKLYLNFIDKLKQWGIKDVQTGEFGTYMSVEIVNDGPVTIMLDSEELKK